MIDSHHHFWHYTTAAYGWISPEKVILRRDYLPPDLIRTAEGLGVTGVVSVQARRDTDENGFLLAQAEACPLVKGVVGWVPLNDPGVERHLEEWGSHTLFKGVREAVQGAPDARYFDNPDFHRGLRLLTASGLSYDLLIKDHQLAKSFDVVKAHPNLCFILDHIGKPDITETLSTKWASDIQRLAQLPNVFCKFSGLITEVKTKTWTVEQLRPYWETVLEAFGVKRLMFGSDWPVCLQRGSYSDWLKAAQTLSASLSTNERNALFEDTARTAYRLR
jgi:L-fuconolactonase